MDLNTKFKRSAICGGVSVVQSTRLGSFSNFSSVACTAASNVGKQGFYVERYYAEGG